MFRISSLFPLVGQLSPVALVNVEQFSTVIDIGKYDQVLAELFLGNTAAETVDFKCYTCASGGGSAVLLKSITQLAASATVNDSVSVEISVTAAEVAAVGSTAQYIKFGAITSSTVGTIASIAVHAYDPRYGTASTNDLASVLQIKN